MEMHVCAWSLDGWNLKPNNNQMFKIVKHPKEKKKKKLVLGASNKGHCIKHMVKFDNQLNHYLSHLTIIVDKI